MSLNLWFLNWRAISGDGNLIRTNSNDAPFFALCKRQCLFIFYYSGRILRNELKQTKFIKINLRTQIRNNIKIIQRVSFSTRFSFFHDFFSWNLTFLKSIEALPCLYQINLESIQFILHFPIQKYWTFVLTSPSIFLYSRAHFPSLFKLWMKEHCPFSIALICWFCVLTHRNPVGLRKM